jgi:hypothetical protein
MMPFLGVIKVKSDVAVTLTASDKNKHVAVLLVGLTVAPEGSKHAVVAPATANRPIKIKASKESMLEIEVHFENAVETGSLRVEVNGDLRDEDDIHGKVVSWMYSCEE